MTNKVGVIELNSFSCSGWYKCNLSAVVNEANQLALREYEDSQ